MNSKNTRVDIWRILRAGLMIALTLSYILQWMKMISSSTERTGTDFIIFYTAGKIVQNYGFSFAYDLGLQQQTEQSVVKIPLSSGQVLPYNHMPYLLPLLKVLVDNDYVASFLRWIVLLLIVYIAGSVFLIDSLFQTSEVRSVESLNLLGAAVTFYPFFVSILLGQDTALLYLGTVLWCVGLLKRKDWMVGIGLALTTVRPHICLMLAIPFLFRDRKIWWRFLVAASILGIASILLIGLGGMKDFINVLIVTAGGSWYGTHQSAMMNFLGLMLRALPFAPENVIRLIAWIGYGLGIGLVSWLWLRSRKFDERLIGLSILAALFFAPHLHYHDLTLLIIPLLLVVRKVKTKIPLCKSIAMIAGISFLLFASPLLPLAYFSLPYILSAILAWSLWKSKMADHRENAAIAVENHKRPF